MQECVTLPTNALTASTVLHALTYGRPAEQRACDWFTLLGPINGTARIVAIEILRAEFEGRVVVPVKSKRAYDI